MAKWNGFRRWRVGVYPLNVYVRKSLQEKPRFFGWRLFWGSRKSWKLVQPAWLAYVCSLSDVKLDYPGDERPVPTWRVQKADYDPDYQWLVADVYITAAVNPYNVQDFERLRRYDSFLDERKPWKQYKQDYVWNVVEELGGRVE